MAYKKKNIEENQTELSDKVVKNKPEENLNEISDKVIEAKAEKVEIVKNGVTRIRMRSEVPGYIAQGWKLK